jgi:hypothetical protein
MTGYVAANTTGNFRTPAGFGAGAVVVADEEADAHRDRRRDGT